MDINSECPPLLFGLDKYGNSFILMMITKQGKRIKYQQIEKKSGSYQDHYGSTFFHLLFLV